MSTKAVDISKKLMGGTFNIKCFPQTIHSREATESIVQSAFKEIERIENQLTIFKDSSLNNINKEAGLSPVKVSSEVISLIEKSIELSKESRGAFDISYASIEDLWRKARKTKILPTINEIHIAKSYVNYRKIMIDKKASTVFLPHKKMKISLGGIGKGYAVDMAYNLMKNSSVKNFYINGAGDIRVHSSIGAKRRWKIGIRNPFNDDPSVFMGAIELTNEACATSGDYVNKTEIAGKNIHHVIDPQTGRSTREIVSSTVIASDSISADTMATISMLLGTKKSLSYFNDKNVIAIIVDKKGNTHLSREAFISFKKYVKFKKEGSL